MINLIKKKGVNPQDEDGHLLPEVDEGGHGVEDAAGGAHGSWRHVLDW